MLLILILVVFVFLVYFVFLIFLEGGMSAAGWDWRVEVRID
jgi:hypothetical protein